MDRRRIKFNGTPAQFGVVVELFDTQMYRTSGYSFSVSPHPIAPDANPVSVRIVSKLEGLCGGIVAQSLPNDRSLLLIEPRGGDWSKLAEPWDMLYAELVSQGWLDNGLIPIAIPKEPKTVTKRAEWRGLYQRAYPLTLDKGKQREHIADLWGISVRTLSEILEWGAWDAEQQRTM